LSSITDTSFYQSSIGQSSSSYPPSINNNTIQQIEFFFKFFRMRIHVLQSIFHPEFNSIFRFSKLACYHLHYLRLDAAACRNMERTFLLDYPPTFVTLRDKPRRLNVDNAKQRWIQGEKYYSKKFQFVVQCYVRILYLSYYFSFMCSKSVNSAIVILFEKHWILKSTIKVTQKSSFYRST
jgi:hypothetical protein